MKIAFVGDADRIAEVFGRGRREALEARVDFVPGVIGAGNWETWGDELRSVEALFSTWGMPVLTREQLEGMPELRAVFYAAGTVEYFARPLWDRGVSVSSAWHANAVPVAEFVLSQILLSCKGFFRNVREYRERSSVSYSSAGRGPGVFGETVSLLGAGAVGMKLIELLRPFRLEVAVFDPFLSPERAAELGVRKVSLEEAFAEGVVVSNHLIDNADTVGLIGGPLLESMRRGATFINTGRGRTVRQDDLIAVFSARPDLTALLDVTDPEPLPASSPLFGMPNVVVSTHIAGSLGDEVHRLADCAIEEFDRFQRGEALLYEMHA